MCRAAQLMFDQRPGNPDDILQAIVAYEKPVTADWPFGELQNALGYVATGEQGNLPSQGVPQVHLIGADGVTVGYVIRPKGLDQDQLTELFWDILLSAGCAEQTDDGGYQYLQDGRPTGAPVCANGEDNVGVRVGAVGWVEPEGNPRFPYEPFNKALVRLMGRLGWQEDVPLFPYRAAAKNGSMVSGLLIAPRVDDMNDNPNADDEAFLAILDSNGLFKRKHKAYRKENFQV
jgi:hypothetical protein